MNLKKLFILVLVLSLLVSIIGCATSGASDPTVYITSTGSKYHSFGCRYLSQSCVPILLSEAKEEGYTPCSVCNPPR